MTEPGPPVIRNPVLRGFHPDPSIVRAGDDYFIATSTFEWWPGVTIHHSRDLVHWRFAGHALRDPKLLDLRGNPDSGGVWAPCLSYHDGTFYLVYTDVKHWSMRDAFKDAHNCLVTGPTPLGPWSDPVHLNSSGFDASLFHDDDGRKWLANMVWDHRSGRHPFAGIVLQEYDADARRLTGPARVIFEGTSLRVTEGPHLYRRDGWYYLVTAEGGTQYEHAVTIARSRDLFGPYEVHPENPLLTSHGRPELELQKAGHASLVETASGEWYLAHLCGRPLEPLGRCNLGRETSLQRVTWHADGWPRVDGGNAPSVTVSAPDLEPHAFRAEHARDDFDAPGLHPRWRTLRVPPDPSWLSVTERPGFLRLRGRESPASRHRQSLVARPLQSHFATVTTTLEFDPDSFQHMAGLIVYYDTGNYLYLRVTRDEALGVVVGVIRVRDHALDEPAGPGVPLGGARRVSLRARFERDALHFAYALDGAEWTPVGPVLDAGELSDERAANGLGFTGTFVGMAAQDLAGTMKAADFDDFEYTEDQP